MSNTNVKNETVATPVEMKVVKNPMTINPEDLLVVDAAKTLLIQKRFNELTANDLKIHQKFPAKVYQEEISIGFGTTREVKKMWRFAMKLAPTVILKRNITEEELSAIQALNPNLISNKAVVNVPAKCISGITESGRRYFRVIACLCESVYFGSSQKNANNNGFLSKLQVTNLCINNNLVKTNPELKKIEFYEVNKDISDSIDIDYTDELVNSNDEF